MQEQMTQKATDLRLVLTRYATGEKLDKDAEIYLDLRSEFWGDIFIRKLLPECVISCRLLEDFWPYIKYKFSTYADRRDFIRQEFEPLMRYLEGERAYFHDDIIGDAVTKFDCDSVLHFWEKALERREADPDGAITAARSLAESVCKQILTERNVAFEDELSLPKLFKLTAQCLNMSAEQHDEAIFKQILGGLQSAIHGFATLRNALGDAHGKPGGGYKPLVRHAELAVNLAGTFASYLIQAHHETYLRSTSN